MVEIRMRTVDQSDRMTEEEIFVYTYKVYKNLIMCDFLVWCIILVVPAKATAGHFTASRLVCLLWTILYTGPIGITFIPPDEAHLILHSI